jgi:curved DNA-binding protein CbpA
VDETLVVVSLIAAVGNRDIGLNLNLVETGYVTMVLGNAYDSVVEVDLYSVLGVSIMASDEELRRSWKKRALENHPDRHAGDPNATIRFQAIQHAYNVLKDPKRRKEYDEALLDRLYAEEYLRRFADLLLTSSGLGLPISYSHSELPGALGPKALGGGDQARRFFLTATMHRSKSFGNLFD